MSVEGFTSDDGTTMLTVQGIDIVSLDDLDALLHAIGLPASERKAVCRDVLCGRVVMAGNREKRITVLCKGRG